MPDSSPTSKILPNRLGAESSPYLRLHAFNPVDWFPWGEDAFSQARAHDKPIFLSIGYFTCHWCHVMERESFSDAAIAELLSRDFISIKVDREERPDVDRLYMAFVQATTGSGGWPLSAFLTPDLKPFFGGTYFPPRDRHGLPGFATVLRSIAQAWREQRTRVDESATEVVESIHRSMQPNAENADADDSFSMAERRSIRQSLFHSLARSYDRESGGFGSAPKFPRPVVLTFLSHFAGQGITLSGPVSDEATLANTMALHTLQAMANGGMRDQLGGGFHRYSTDREWLVPHFEIMLYDQAQLAIAYLDAWQTSQDPFFEAVARGVLDFCVREMSNGQGAFYSALDADSDIPLAHRQHSSPGQGEGAYYLWTAAEIDSLLSQPAASFFSYAYDVAPAGNVPRERDPHGEFAAKNILHVAATSEQTAQHFGRSVADIEQILAHARSRLYAERLRRPHPPTDDKIITAWNGLMMSALARAGAVLEREDYVECARQVASALRGGNFDQATGTLTRRDCKSGPQVAGFLEDYAFLIQGLLDLFEADFGPRWLLWARELQSRQDDLFASAQGGYFSGQEDPVMWMRMREDYDGAEPSANAVAIFNLLRLGHWFDEEAMRDRAHRTLASCSSRLRQTPEAVPLLVVAMDAVVEAPRTIVIAGEPCAEATRALLREARRHPFPHVAVLVLESGERHDALRRLNPFFATMTPRDGRATAYLCEHYVCRQPVHSPGELARMLRQGSPAAVE